MLYKEAVSPFLLKTLKELMSMEELSSFRLVGGTALSLQLGHRKSDDIDLFTPISPIDPSISQKLKVQYPQSQINFSAFSISLYIPTPEEEELKVDLMSNEEFIRPPLFFENIRIAQIPDIAAMKLEAISSRKEKKDFWDIHEILNIFTFKQIFGFYKERYPWNDIREILEGFAEMDFCDFQPDPLFIKKTTWLDIKKSIMQKLNDFVNIELNLEPGTDN